MTSLSIQLQSKIHQFYNSCKVTLNKHVNREKVITALALGALVAFYVGIIWLLVFLSRSIAASIPTDPAARAIYTQMLIQQMAMTRI